MFKLYDLQNTKTFNSSKVMVDYCLNILRLPPKAVIRLIANGKYHGIKLEFMEE